MWRTEYSAEARSYLADNGALVADLFHAIETIRFTEGLPDIGAMEVEPEFYYWLTDDHIVAYQRIESKKVCRIISIRPE
jgi:hypothetical protein